jgi:F-type H+-transporting ATPase subunit a
MLQPEHIVETATGAETAVERFKPGETIIEHVANSSLDHPLIHLQAFGIDLSITKHVLMVWVVAATVFVVVTLAVRRYLRQDRHIPSGFMNALEFIVLYLRDNVVEPNVGRKHVSAWTPFLITLFVFIFTANLIGIIPVFDVLSLINHTVVHAPEDAFFTRVLHGGPTATGNFNVTAALATLTFFAIIIAGTRTHGFVQHWKNLVPHGVPLWLYPLLIPLEIIGMLVRPFALTARLAGNMTGGHIAILAILSLVFVFAELFGQVAGIGVGLVLSLPVGVGLLALELIVILVQAYVFTLLSAVFIGMAIHAHH